MSIELALAGQNALLLLDLDTHVASISALATVALVLGDTLLSGKTGVLASLARTLAIATLLALAAPLATWLGRQVLLVLAELMLEVESRSDRSLTAVI